MEGPGGLRVVDVVYMNWCERRIVRVLLSDGTARRTLPDVLSMREVGRGSAWPAGYDSSPLVLQDGRWR